jgi:hypothetical protein
MSFAENCEIKPGPVCIPSHDIVKFDVYHRVMHPPAIMCNMERHLHNFAATLCNSVKITQLALLLHVAKTAPWPPGRRLPVPQWGDKCLSEKIRNWLLLPVSGHCCGFKFDGLAWGPEPSMQCFRQVPSLPGLGLPKLTRWLLVRIAWVAIIAIISVCYNLKSAYTLYGRRNYYYGVVFWF